MIKLPSVTYHENFLLNQQIFEKTFQIPHSQERVQLAQYQNAENMWKIVNFFMGDSHLQTSINNMQKQIEELMAK